MGNTATWDRQQQGLCVWKGGGTAAIANGRVYTRFKKRQSESQKNIRYHYSAAQSVIRPIAYLISPSICLAGLVWREECKSKC